MSAKHEAVVPAKDEADGEEEGPRVKRLITISKDEWAKGRLAFEDEYESLGQAFLRCIELMETLSKKPGHDQVSILKELARGFFAGQDYTDVLRFMAENDIPAWVWVDEQGITHYYVPRDVARRYAAQWIATVAVDCP